MTHFIKKMIIEWLKTSLWILDRGKRSINQRNQKYLQTPSAGISSHGLHPYAGKASYVGASINDQSNKASNVAVIRPRPQNRNPSISSTTVETGEELTPLKPPRNRKWYNLFGVIDTSKLSNLLGRGIFYCNMNGYLIIEIVWYMSNPMFNIYHFKFRVRWRRTSV